MGFQKAFQEYGADYQTTMERFMGNEALYLRILDMLFPDENLQKLGAALNVGDKDGAFEVAHTLKGVVGNLGLSPLYDAICAIMEPLRVGEERDDYPDLYRAVQSEYQSAHAFRNILKESE